MRGQPCCKEGNSVFSSHPPVTSKAQQGVVSSSKGVREVSLKVKVRIKSSQQTASRAKAKAGGPDPETSPLRGPERARSTPLQGKRPHFHGVRLNRRDSTIKDHHAHGEVGHHGEEKETRAIKFRPTETLDFVIITYRIF